MKKLLSIVLVVIIACSMFGLTKANTTSQTISNPNPELSQLTSVAAIRNSLKLVWSDEFGGEIGCGAERETLVTTNGTDAQGNPTSDEVRATAKWRHERFGDGMPVTRHGQLQHYVIEDGRNSWTEDGILHLRAQKEAEPYVDPITGKSYLWTADSLMSSYFDKNTKQSDLQAFRYGMMEARIYTVNGKALEDENGNPVYDADGNIMQDPKYSQGLWNGFWTVGVPDMSEETTYVRNQGEKRTWPYCGEIDICEAFTSPSAYSTYDSKTAGVNHDEYGIIITASQYIVKYDANGKILITTTDGAPIVSYNTSSSSYVVTEGYESKYTVSGDEVTIALTSVSHIVKQDENGKIYISDDKNKTIVDTEGNCYGYSVYATGQLHYRTGERHDGSLVTGVTNNVKTEGLGGGYKVTEGKAGQAMLGDTGYHTYGVYWTPTQLFYYYDDLIVGYHDITPAQYFQLRECPQYIYLTFPVGGTVPGDPNPALDAAEYLVDYVRIYQADDGYNTDDNYQGSYGFPELNALDQPVSYYKQATDAYSHISITNINTSCELSNGATTTTMWSAPFRTNGKVCTVQSKGTIKTTSKQPEGKYDVYISGITRKNSKDFIFSLNGVSIGNRLNLSDHLKDKYGRDYLGGKSVYIGTVEIVNGEHNLQIDVERVDSQYGDASQHGRLYTIVLLRNEKSTPTVTIDSDTPVVTTENVTSASKTSQSASSSEPPTQANVTTILSASDVSSIDNYIAGYWNHNSGAFQEHTKRIATKGFVAVDSRKTYTLSLKGHGSFVFYLAEYDKDKMFVSGIGSTKIANTSFTYQPKANVAYIALTLSIGDSVVAEGSNGIFDRWTKNGYTVSLTADSEDQVAILTLKEASIRLNEKTGIRFYTSVDTEVINTYKNDGYTVEMGTLIAPEDLIKDELTFETEKFVDVKYESNKLYQDSDFSGIVGSIVNIKEKNIARNFVGRGYLKLTKDGETNIIYSDTVSTCSAKFIASKIQEVDNWEEIYQQEQVDLIKKWALAS